jgi:hypothetical protein
MNEIAIYVAVTLVWGVICFLFGKGRRVADLEALDRLGHDLPTLILDYQTVQRKASEYLEKIEEVIAEREVWRELYNDQAGGHDNAQALMLQTITSLVHLHKKETGKTPKIDPLIETVRDDWTTKHGPEVREKLGDDGRPREDQTDQPD